MNETIIKSGSGQDFTILKGGYVVPGSSGVRSWPLPPVISKELPPMQPETPKAKKEVPASEFLEEASRVMKARATQRDAENGERSMAKTVEMFNAYKGLGLSESDGWVFMVLLKLVRGSQGQFHMDDYVDGSAYFSLLGEAESKGRKHREDSNT